MGPQIAVIIGSETDLPIVEGSKMLDVLDQCGISWELSIISADRNPEALSDYCSKASLEGVRLFIGAAGMAARLPGAIAAFIYHQLPVIGVALTSEEFPSAEDATYSIIRTPAGCPVLFAGIGKAGLKNAAIIAAQIIGNGQDIASKEIKEKLLTYLLNNRKQTRVAFKTSQRKEG